jgi:hypothetical protein
MKHFDIYFIALWNILRTFWMFQGHVGHFLFIWYILVSCTKKNLATLVAGLAG